MAPPARENALERLKSLLLRGIQELWDGLCASFHKIDIQVLESRLADLWIGQ